MARGLRGVFRRGLAATMVTGLATIGAVALTAAPASAHTNNVKGTAECVDGQYVVEWTVTNQDPKVAEKLKVEVLPKGSELELADKVEAGKTITGTQTLPKGSRGVKDAEGRNVAKIHVVGEWKDGDKTLTDEDFVDVPLPGRFCGETPEPSKSAEVEEPAAAIELSCEVFQIDLTNPTDRPVKYTVAVKFDDEKPLSQDFVVRPGKTLTLPDDLEDEADFKAFAKAGDEDFEVSNIAVAVFAKGDKLDAEALDLDECEEGARPTESAEPSESPSASVAPVDDEAAPSVSPAANSESEDGSLPVTGASLGGLLAGAVLILGLGVGMVVVTRRRKRA